MAHSASRITLVLVENYSTGKAAWMTPSAAARLTTFDPCYCQVETSDPRYDALVKDAGPMPDLYVRSTESYKEE